MAFGRALSYAARKGIRLISGGANQKTTQGILRGAGTTSKAGVETMGSMGTLPSKLGRITKTPPAKGRVETMGSMGTAPANPAMSTGNSLKLNKLRAR